MNRLLFATCVVLWAASPRITRAAVFERDWQVAGDGLLTFDDVNRREWLDIPESLLSLFPGISVEARIQYAETQLQPGGSLEGFTLARIPDVISLAQSAGIDTGTEDLSVNQFPTTALIDLLGMTFIDENGSFWSAGYLDDFSGPPPSFCPCRQSAFLFVGFRTETAGLTFLDDIGLDLDLLFETTGLMLYRQVPEPTAISLAVILVIIWAPIWRLKSRLRRR